jgi:hypothetical protein
MLRLRARFISSAVKTSKYSTPRASEPRLRLRFRGS